MRLEVGDWVKLRGYKSIYEVQAVSWSSSGRQYLKIGERAGESRVVPASKVVARAQRFWIRVGEQ